MLIIPIFYGGRKRLSILPSDEAAALITTAFTFLD